MADSVWLIRHGETEWSLSGAHTGRTDLALTERGRQLAVRLGEHLAGRPFALVLASPLRRATETCRLAGYGSAAVADPDLREWDYGGYEGRTTADIRAERPGWDPWRDGFPGGETIAQVAARADRAIARAAAASGDAALFAHGHLLRILAARWLGLPPEAGRLLALDTASWSVLGYERETRVVRGWNRSVAGERRALP
jgi:broad specificity phosphatase PhoE